MLESVGVSAEAALDKMRLMALLVLGSRANGTAVSFSDIQAALDISLEQVGGLLPHRLPLHGLRGQNGALLGASVQVVTHTPSPFCNGG